MTAYYNEIDPFAAAWLRELIKAGHIAPGEVDERDIRDVRPSELAGYTQCHFFAGIGVWSYALRNAGWTDDRPVWTGSCPCQPFSAAGKGGGFDDERHLWPAYYHLIEVCRPPVIFGEQVGSKPGLAWLDLVHTDMEAAGYAFGATDLCAAGVGAPHIRQRLYFVAESEVEQHNRSGHEGRGGRESTDCGATELHMPHGVRLPESRNRTANDQQRMPDSQLEPEALTLLHGAFTPGELADSEHTERGSVSLDRQDERDRYDDGRPEAHGIAGACGEVLRLGHPSRRGLGINGRAPGDAGHADEPEQAEFMGDTDNARPQGRGLLEATGSGDCTNLSTTRPPSATNGFWSNAEWIACRDGKSRPVEPGIAPLVNGATNRVGRLRGYGNAICAPVAEEFIRAYLES